MPTDLYTHTGTHTHKHTHTLFPMWNNLAMCAFPGKLSNREDWLACPVIVAFTSSWFPCFWMAQDLVFGQIRHLFEPTTFFSSRNPFLLFQNSPFLPSTSIYSLVSQLKLLTSFLSSSPMLLRKGHNRYFRKQDPHDFNIPPLESISLIWRDPSTYGLPGVRHLVIFINSVTEAENQKQRTAPESILFGSTKHHIRSH